MPYNPSSAYPRHSTYTPPVYGRGFARGFNEFDWSQRFGHAGSMPGVDVGHAIRSGMQRPTGDNIAGALTAQNRKGLASIAGNTLVARAQQKQQTQRARREWNRAEYGDDPNEQTPAEQFPTEIDTRTPEGRAAAAKIWPTAPGVTSTPSGTGGRTHVGGVNDRLNAIAERETRTSAMNDTVEKVLSGKIGGPMMVPKLIFGAARAASRRRK